MDSGSSVGGHTKMDIKLLEVSSMTIRFDEKNCCEGHTCQGEGGSEFKRLQNLLIILWLRNSETYRPIAWETKYVYVSTVCYMDESLDEHMSTLYGPHITLSDGSWS